MQKGSPPRVRGTEDSFFLLYPFYRITPACAGNRYLSAKPRRRHEDHPRVCGEQGRLGAFLRFPPGSPPRVRGTGRADHPLYLHLGITPACAGNSRFRSRATSPSRDHPRVCGEQYPSFLLAARLKGSPPRVRGTVINLRAAIHTIRITPACAGNSFQSLLPWVKLEDHPRVCGEQPDARLCRRDHYGSPPRVRGTVLTKQNQASARWITPACAGNRTACIAEYGVWEDHPRVCGEQYCPIAA